MHLTVIFAFASLLWFNSIRPWNFLGLSPAGSVAVVIGQMLAILGLATWATRRTLRRLEADPADPNEAHHFHHVYSLILHTTLLVFFVGDLTLSAWPQVFRGQQSLKYLFGLSELLILSPFLITTVLIWVVEYPVDRAIRELALNPRIEGSHPVYPVWSLGQYLDFNIRYQLLSIAVPMTFIIVADAALAHYAVRIRAAMGGVFWANDAIMGLVVSVVFVLAPVMLRFILATEPIPAGPLRSRLEELAKTLNIRYRDILIWHSRGMIINAAVMGILPPVRYVLISDGLLESMSDEHILGVFGHEAGHVRYWHMPYFILFMILAMLIAGGLLEFFRVAGPAWMTPAVGHLVVGAVMVILWTLGFGKLSYVFEHQADISGAMSVAPVLECNEVCLVHSPNAPMRSTALCASAVRKFGEALERVAVLNGIPPDESGWRHPAINVRIAFLRRLSEDPDESVAFARKIRMFKVLLIAGTLLGMALGAIVAWERLWPRSG